MSNGKQKIEGKIETFKMLRSKTKPTTYIMKKDVLYSLSGFNFVPNVLKVSIMMEIASGRPFCNELKD